MRGNELGPALKLQLVELAVPVKSRLEDTNTSLAPPEECH